MYDAESAISATTLPPISAVALVAKDREHGEETHVTDANTPSERTAAALLAVYPAPRATVHDAESAISVSTLPHTSAVALAAEDNGHGVESHVTGP